jgi:hypothetical protein
MPNVTDQQFENLDAYERFVQGQIETWLPARRTTLAAAMAERWLHAYEAFSLSESWGDPAVLRQGLEAAWAVVRGEPAAMDWSRLKNQLHEVTPHLDDFDANEALCVCVMVHYAALCCQQAENQSHTVMAVLSGLEAVRPDLLTGDHVPMRWWKQAGLQRELNKQLRLIKRINALTDLRDVPGGLRPFLSDPAMVGEARPRKAKKAPIALSNRSAFEMYKRMVQADIRGAAGNLDPKQNQELAPILYLATWLGRYHRRKDLITGEYGALADRAALDRLVAKNRARDGAEPDLPAWEAEARWVIDTTYQNSFNRLDVNAVEAPHGYGPSLRKLWVEAKRRGLSDAEAWESITAWAYHQPEAWSVSSKRRKQSLEALTEYLDRPITWKATDDPDFPWRADIEGAAWLIRLNDFPDELMYSLLLGGTVVADFHDWPKAWQRE